MMPRDAEVQAVGSVLADMAARMEDLQKAVSAMMTGSSAVSAESVSALQDADRLTQELAALGTYVTNLSNPDSVVDDLRQAIPLVSLQRKLTYGAGDMPTAVDASFEADEVWL